MVAKQTHTTSCLVSFCCCHWSPFTFYLLCPSLCYYSNFELGVMMLQAARRFHSQMSSCCKGFVFLNSTTKTVSIERVSFAFFVSNLFYRLGSSRLRNANETEELVFFSVSSLRCQSSYWLLAARKAPSPMYKAMNKWRACHLKYTRLATLCVKPKRLTSQLLRKSWGLQEFPPLSVPLLTKVLI